MAIEQPICEVASGIAGGYASECKANKNQDQADKWLQAARDLRFPFWDWTDKSTGVEGIPSILRDETVQLIKSDGQTYDHPNVLAYYSFNKPVDGFTNRLEIVEIQTSKPLPEDIAYFREWNRTYRRPNSSPIDVTEDYNALNADLENRDERGGWANLTNDISALFTVPMNIHPDQWANIWDEFSNTTFQSSRPDNHGNHHSPYVWNIPPIEQPHNRVHLVVGGLGHMSDNDTAGFDPIFFLHHCNVDRILSFWEHIYPDYTAGTKGYLDVDGITRVPFTQANGTFIETSTQTVDGNTPLMPFRKSDYTYWNSDDTHSLQLFDPDKDPEQAVRNKYYTYLPIAGVDLNPKVPPTPEQRDQQRAKLQAYFEYNPKKAADSNKVEMPSFDRKDPIYRTIPLGFEIPEKAVPVKNFRQFAVSVSLSPDYCKGRSYSVNVGMEVKGNIKTVGTVTVLGRGTIANCGNCQARRAAKTRVRGVVYVPSDVVDDILVAAPITRSLSSQAAAQDSPAPTVDANELVTILHTSLRSEVVLPSGKIHSNLKKEIADVPEDQAPPPEVVPTMKLLSCQPYQLHPEREHSPFNLGTWLNHGPPSGRWALA